MLIRVVKVVIAFFFFLIKKTSVEIDQFDRITEFSAQTTFTDFRFAETECF